jgi:hypothetical protein
MIVTSSSKLGFTGDHRQQKQRDDSALVNHTGM